MKLLYIAGPYTNPDPVMNTNAAIQVGMDLYERSLYLPHIPHATLLWHLVAPRPIAYWYALDSQLLARCDAFLRLPGDSTGADQEQDLAHIHGLEWIRFNDLPDETQSLWNERDAKARCWL